MREIKFKAWHKSERKMCDVDIINLDSGAFLLGLSPGKDEIGDKYYVKAPEDGRFCTFDEFELLEYIGLSDKNGKEIYEGYIVSIDNSEPEENGEYDPITVCKYIDGGFILEDMAGGHWTRQLWHQQERLTIIGNIYEHENLWLVLASTRRANYHRKYL